MGVLDREFPEPGSADQYLESLKLQLTEASEKLNLLVSGGGGGGGWCIADEIQDTSAYTSVYLCVPLYTSVHGGICFVSRDNTIEGVL